MGSRDTTTKSFFAAFAAGAAPVCPTSVHAEEFASLTGTWVMDAAYEIHPDGSRTSNYREHPKGVLVADAAGRYDMQIFKPDRPAVASGDKARGTYRFR
jgi:hypothetical protein